MPPGNNHAALLFAAGAVGVGLAAGAAVYASAWPTSQIFGRTLIAGHVPGQIALTFDDGPNPAATPQLLEVLARHNVKATFFAMGSYARQQPDLVRQVVADGHLLGNHTINHPRLSTQSSARIRQELTDCNAALEDITGSAVHYFRPPFGARRPIVLRIARELGLTPVMWNVTGYDWELIGVKGILNNLNSGIARNCHRGRSSNLLLHDGSHRGIGWQRMDTVHAVDRLLTEHAGTATEFVTADAWG